AEESFAGVLPLLEAPAFTRSREFRGVEVPEVLTSGDHEAIRLWRRREALRRTLARRPDLLEKARADGRLDAEARKLLDELAKTR
ncbi:MAG TPA: tRNA (guanosine(37)-N1)-methyltransferase TrmD, partial [bacterium]|nr:tRNA (guanosine(37)-N1)-methyltransferase TrmD [bacterium]